MKKIVSLFLITLSCISPIYARKPKAMKTANTKAIKTANTNVNETFTQELNSLMGSLSKTITLEETTKIFNLNNAYASKINKDNKTQLSDLINKARTAIHDSFTKDCNTITQSADGSVMYDQALNIQQLNDKYSKFELGPNDKNILFNLMNKAQAAIDKQKNQQTALQPGQTTINDTAKGQNMPIMDTNNPKEGASANSGPGLQPQRVLVTINASTPGKCTSSDCQAMPLSNYEPLLPIKHKSVMPPQVPQAIPYDVNLMKPLITQFINTANSILQLKKNIAFENLTNEYKEIFEKAGRMAQLAIDTQNNAFAQQPMPTLVQNTESNSEAHNALMQTISSIKQLSSDGSVTYDQAKTIFKLRDVYSAQLNEEDKNILSSWVMQAQKTIDKQNNAFAQQPMPTLVQNTENNSEAHNALMQTISSIKQLSSDGSVTYDQAKTIFKLRDVYSAQLNEEDKNILSSWVKQAQKAINIHRELWDAINNNNLSPDTTVTPEDAAKILKLNDTYSSQISSQDDKDLLSKLVDKAKYVINTQNIDNRQDTSIGTTTTAIVMAAPNTITADTSNTAPAQSTTTPSITEPKPAELIQTTATLPVAEPKPAENSASSRAQDILAAIRNRQKTA